MSYFHVTFANRVAQIMRDGLTINPRRRRTWQNRFGAALGNPAAVYAFRTFDGAVLWAHKQSFDHGTPRTGPAVIVEFEATEAAWRDDDNDTVAWSGGIMAETPVAATAIRCVHLLTVERTREAIANRNAALRLANAPAATGPTPKGA